MINATFVQTLPLFQFPLKPDTHSKFPFNQNWKIPSNLIYFSSFPKNRVVILTVTMMNLTLIQIFPHSLIPMSFQQHMSITRLFTVMEMMRTVAIVLMMSMNVKADIWMKSMWLQKSNNKCGDEKEIFSFFFSHSFARKLFF